MLDENDTTPTTDQDTESQPPTESQPAADSQTSAVDAPTEAPSAEAPPAARKTARKTTARKTTAKRAAKKTAAPADDRPTDPTDPTDPLDGGQPPLPVEPSDPSAEPDGSAPAEAPVKKTARKAVKKATAKKATAKRTTKKAAAADLDVLAAEVPEPDLTDLQSPAPDPIPAEAAESTETAEPVITPVPETPQATVSSAPSLLFKAPDPVSAPVRSRASAPAPAPAVDDADEDEDALAAEEAEETDEADTDAGTPAEDTGVETGTSEDDSGADAGSDSDNEDEQSGNRRRRRRGGRRRRRGGGSDDSGEGADAEADEDDEAAVVEAKQSDDADEESGQGGGRGSGRRGSGGRGRRSRGSGQESTEESSQKDAGQKDAGQKDAGQRDSGQKDSGQKESGQNGSQNGSGQRGSGSDKADEQIDADGEEGTGSRRRRRRRRTGEDGDGGTDDPQNTVTRVRKPRNAEDEITALHGSTRLEAKKQRRREGREAGRRRAPIVSEAEFLARREAVDRVMVIRQRADLTQIAVLEDKVLVEHYVARESQTSLIGNVYLGRVQNVLPSMEAAFIDIGKGRNAVLYAGEVNWDSLGAGNGPRKIESVLKSGQPILVQVSKDPIGHKGARLTSQISLPGRFLVYVPDGTTSGISRKLPDTERNRLKSLLKEIVPDSAGVIVRTAAEGASEEELTLDVERLTARWNDIESKVAKGNAPQLLYGEPDLTLKVVRDLFTEDFAKLVVSGDEAWDMVDSYVKHVAPDLEERLERYAGEDDVFAAYRIDEQIAKGLDRKVWLPSGGSLIIDRTEAMTVVDVNTGKFTGSGGNLEETVTKNNLEAAEEMIRQLRLRDIGGIIVVDFIDMVLESNRDLVLRRLVECLGRDRTRHQVAEVTSLGLVQMTRKRIGTGLLEAFSETCEHCQGRGLLVHHEPVESSKRMQEDEPRRGRRGRRGGEDGDASSSTGNGSVVSRPPSPPSPKDLAAMAKHDHRPVDDAPVQRSEQPVAAAEAQADSLAATSSAGPERTSTVDEPIEPLDLTAAAEAPAPAPAPGTGGPEPTGSEPTSSEPTSSQPSAPGVAGSGSPASQPTAPEPTAPEPVPTGPVVVKTTRRRVARRPAGSATPATPQPVAAEPVTAPPVTAPPVTAPPVAAQPTELEPTSSESTPAAEPAAPVAPAAPVVVSSSRRRVARRPAGPPSGASEPVTGLPDALSDGRPVQVSGDGFPDGASPDGVGDIEEEHAESMHVPVKKKGSRKR